MAPVRRRRTTLLAAVAGLLVVVVVALAWLTADDPDPTGVGAAGVATTAADPPAVGEDAATTTAAGGATTQSGSPAGDAGAGAGPGTSGQPAPPAPACAKVLSGPEAAAALGAAVARLESRDGFLVRSCTFWSSGDRYLLVQVHRGVAASRDQYELSRLPADRPVAGIGQAARWTPDTGLLDVLDGAARFQVGLFTPRGAPDAASPPAGVQAAARAVAARL